MKVLSNNILRKIKCHINNNGVIAYPTEYCFGIGCHYKNLHAVQKVIRLKGRNSTKGMIVITGNIRHFKLLINIDKDYTTYWPGPNTLLVHSNNRFIRKNVGGKKNNTIALRVSSHEIVIQLCDYLNHALISTSANYSGRFPAKNTKECYRMFGKKLLVIPGLTNFRRKPSTIINYETKEILR